MSAGWEVSLGEGQTLRAMVSADHERPLLGVMKGKTYLVLAEFISEADMEEMKHALEGVVLIPTRTEAVDVAPPYDR